MAGARAGMSQMSVALTSESKQYASKARDLHRQVRVEGECMKDYTSSSHLGLIRRSDASAPVAFLACWVHA
jgi:hypothetical protein